jgi:hypothetical protein
MRWHYRDAGLLWLFPIAYLAHLAEEFWGGPGFPAWFAHFAGRPLPVSAFVGINTVAFALMLAGTVMAIRRERAGWAAVAIATVVTINALLHAAGSVTTRTYSPGLITGVVLYLPLGQLLLIRALHQVDRASFSAGVLIGVAVHAAVVATAYAASRSLGA